MKKSAFQDIIKEELVKVLKNKSYLKEFKKLVKEADYKDVSNKFKKTLDKMPDDWFSKSNIEKLAKLTREKRPDAAMAYAKDAFGWIGKGKWLKEADLVKEADYKYFRQYLIKIGKELGDKRLVQAAEKASDSKIKTMFKKDLHYKIFKDDEVQKLSGKQLHGKIKYDQRFNEGKLNEAASVDTSMTKKELLRRLDSLMAGSLGVDDKSLLKKIAGMIIKASQKNIHKFDASEDGSLTKRWLKEDKVKEVLSKIKGNSPADKGKRAAVEDDIARAKKKGDSKEVKKLKEGGKKVTQAMWKKMDVYQRMDALLTILKNPNDAEKYIEKNWQRLPNNASSMTTESALKALKEFKTFYKK